ncbi:hypothetical protein KY366_05570 [Candidatus Woesearchaeota archaeon]|nr:hypothetical protein [Candidatus Woesearchaeota archaeon]
MIVLGNPEFATGMKLAGIKDSYAIRKREDALGLLAKIDRKEFILANFSVIRLIPELDDFRNVISIPDKAEKFLTTDDLKGIIKSAIGIELDL